MSSQQRDPLPGLDTSNTQYTRSMHAADRECVLDLWERRYGLPAPGMVSAAVDEDRWDIVGYTAIVGEERAGFSIGCVWSVEMIRDEWGFDLKPHVSHRLNGVLFQVCVEPEFECRGIGSMLTRARLDYFRDLDRVPLYHVFAMAWLRDGHDSSDHLEKFGFEPIGFFDNYFAGSDRRCPDCGVDCSCDTEVYLKRIARPDGT